MKIGVISHPLTPVNRPDFNNPVPDADDIYIGPLVQGMSDVASEHSVELVFDQIVLEDLFSYVRSRSPDGIVFLSLGLADLTILTNLDWADLGLDNAVQSQPIPYVAVGGSPGPGHGDLPCVDASNRDAGHAVASYLIALGHTRLGCINLASNYTNHADRLQGFMEGTIAAGQTIEFDCILAEEGYRGQTFQGTIQRWLEHHQRRGSLPTAIFACDYNMAWATFHALNQLEIRIPDDVSLIGFDDPPGAAKLVPALTTVAQPVYEIGRRAVERVLEALADPQHPKVLAGTEILPTRLMERASVAPPPF